ncbi:MAG TPA: phage holin family protein [Clostridia bacterium]|nr:phage holin family protein [Clostridia bacterium]
MNFEMTVKAVLAAIGGALVYLFGPCDALIIALVAVVALDYITGVMSAAFAHKLSSSEGFRGLLKKVAIFVLVALASLLDKLVPATNEAVRASVCVFYIANEGISILENVSEMGVPLPKILKEVLEKLDAGLEKKDGDGKNTGA